MDSVSIDKILELRPDTVQYVRKLYDLDKPGSMEQAVDILNEWVQKQDHFNKKHFSRHYLEMSIIACKGSIERAKLQLDRICTMRTVMPEFFGKFNVKTDFVNVHKVAQSIILPKLTDDHYRIYIAKFNNEEWVSSELLNFYRTNIIRSEYIKARDYLNGFIMIVDFSEVDNILNFLKKLNVFQLKQSMNIIIEGYGMRLKGIHIISKSNFVDNIVMLFKQIVSAKVAKRINIIKSSDGLHQYFPKTILPKDYGGEERSLSILQEEWNNVLSLEEHLNHLQDMSEATTNESRRQKDKFSENYAGIPGTFKVLSVD